MTETVVDNNTWGGSRSILRKCLSAILYIQGCHWVMVVILFHIILNSRYMTNSTVSSIPDPFPGDFFTSCVVSGVVLAVCTGVMAWRYYSQKCPHCGEVLH